jgi:tRNA(Ile)-lysidine synthase
MALCGGGAPSGRLDLPGGARAYRQYDKLVFTRGEPRSGFAAVTLTPGALAELYPGMTVACGEGVCCDIINKSFTVFVFNKRKICGKLVVRTRAPGDALRLAGRNGSKSLKKLFIENRVPERLRASVPIVADDCGPLAAPGIGQDARSLPQAGGDAVTVGFLKRLDMRAYDGKRY